VVGWTVAVAVIRAFRQARALSQERLADLAELDRTDLGGIERAKRRPTFNALDAERPGHCH